MFVSVVFAWGLIPTFFEESTSNLERAIIRGVFVVAAVSAYIEAGSRTCTYISMKGGIDATSSHLLILRPLMAMIVCGRVMQGSADSLGEMLLYEGAGTLAELVTADQLLRGYIPSTDVLAQLRHFGLLKGKEKGVVPVSSEGLKTPDSSDPELAKGEAADKATLGKASMLKPTTPKTDVQREIIERNAFCAHTMVLMSIW